MARAHKQAHLREGKRMRNIKAEIKDKKLILTIDLDAPTVPSKSGKTQVIASTLGNKELAEGVFVGVNVYRY